MKILMIGIPMYNRAFKNFDATILDADYSLPAEITPATVDLAVFTGGADVSPRLYNATPLPETRTDPRRDFREVNLYKILKKQNIPMVGICRGAQFLNVMNGGSLKQHVNNHCVPHTMHINMMLGDIPNEIRVNSTHHQMMEVPKNGQILAYAKNIAFGGKANVEPEVVFFPETRNLCVQYHPEILDESSDGFKYFETLVKELIINVNV